MGLVALARDRSVQPGINQSGSERLRVNIGGCNFVAGVTLVSVVKLGAARDGTWRNLLCSLNSSAAAQGWAFEVRDTNKLFLTNLVTSNESTTAVTSADGWVLLAATKAAGATNVTFYGYKFATGTWFINGEAPGGPFADGTLPGATGLLDIGGDAGGSLDWFAGDYHAAAVFNRVLTKGELVPFVYSFDYWYSARPNGFWRPRGLEFVRDLTGLGANEVSRTGLKPTSIAATSLPLPYIEDRQSRGLLIVNLPGGGVAKNVAGGTINGVAAVSAALTKLAAVKPASIGGASVVSATVTKFGAVRPATINGTATVSASLTKLAAVRAATISGTSAVSATVTGSTSTSALTNPADGWISYYYG